MPNAILTKKNSELFLLIGSGRLAHQVAEIMKRIDTLRDYRFFSYCRHAALTEKTPFERIFQLPDSFAFAAAIGNPFLRQQEVDNVENSDQREILAASIISPEVHIEKSADIFNSGGLIILPGAILNSGCQLGNHTIIGSGAIVEHDSVVEQFSTIGPGSVICGSVKIGSHTFIGANSTIIQNINIGSASVIGAGSVVVRDIDSNSLAMGNPCRVKSRAGDSHRYI